jgi:hypothetical protein
MMLQNSFNFNALLTKKYEHFTEIITTIFSNLSMQFDKRNNQKKLKQSKKPRYREEMEIHL